MSEVGATRISARATRKLVEQALLAGGVASSRIEVTGKAIRVFAAPDDVSAAQRALSFDVLLDAGLLDYRLQVELGL